MLGGDAIRARIDLVSVTAVALTVARIEEHTRVSLTGEEKKRVRSALTNEEVM